MDRYNEKENYLKHLKNSPEFMELSIDEVISPVDEIVLKNDQTVFQKSLFNLNNHSITVMRHPNEIPVLPHRHDFFEMEYVSSGSVRQIINGKQMLLHEKSIFIFNQHIIHQILIAPDNAEMYHIMVNPSLISLKLLKLLNPMNTIGQYLFDGIISPQQNRGYIQINNINQNIQTVISSMYREDRLNLPDGNHLITSNFVSLLILLDRLLKDNYAAPRNEKPNQFYRAAQEIMDYIENNLSTATLAEASALLHISEKHLCYILKKTTGKTFTQIHAKSRIELATYLLTSTDQPVENIAERVGFENTTYFYRVFKSLIGITPKQFRQSGMISI